MPEIPEPTEKNHVATLLERIDRNVTVVSENVLGLRSEFDAFKMALFDVDGIVNLILPAVQSNTKDIQEIKKTNGRIEGDVKALKKDVTELKKDVKDVKERLTAVEAK